MTKNKNMKHEFRVINRTTGVEKVFSSEELKRFFYCEYNPHTEKIKYKLSYVKTKTEKILIIINCLAIAGISLYLLSQWI
tara:strand:- start:957 stop:1196 length:240 start_codon:yes stop_codon:yes gene_type:complete